MDSIKGNANIKIEAIIEKHHKKIQVFETNWVKIKDGECNDIKAWLYDFILFLAYHFYTEEYFMSESVDDDQRHISNHREILNSACRLLDNSDNRVKLISGIELIFNEYLTNHLIHIDPTLDFNSDEKHSDYFLNDEHCGITVLQFKKGFITVFYGKLSGDVLKSYFQFLGGMIEKLDDQWMKTVDLSRWDLTTFDAVDVAIERNKVQHEAGCQHVLYFTQDDNISRFIVEKIAATSDHINTCYKAEKMIESNIFEEIIQSQLIDIKVVAAHAFIFNYYDVKYPDNLLNVELDD